MNRRGFLGVMAKVPVVGIAARQALEQEAASLARIAGVGSGAMTSIDAVPGNPPGATPDQFRAALRFPSIRKEIESLIYEEERRVHSIDPDLAVMRSFSFSAKIAYQRQRNVAGRLDHVSQGPEAWPWKKMQNLVLKAIGLKLL